MRKIAMILVSVLLLGVLGTSALAATSNSKATTKTAVPVKIDTKKVMMTINGRAVTWNELANWIRPLSVANKAGGATQTQLDTYVKQNTENYITLQLLLVYAKEHKMIADEKEVSKQFTEMATQMASADYYGSKAAYDKILVKSGVTSADMKNMLREFVVTGAVQRSIVDKIKVSDQELHEQYLLQNGKATAKHILVATLAKAKELKKQLDAGAVFTDIAKKESTDTGSGAQGGELGEFELKSMVPEFSKALLTMKPNQISGPVKSQFGYHIIQLEALTLPDESKFQAAKASLVSPARSAKSDVVLQKFIKDLRAKAKIVIAK